MTSIELEIRNPSGLHARPAAMFVRACGAQRARIRVRNVTRGTAEVDGKSLLGVLGLGVSQGHVIAISADGEEEASAVEAIRAAVEGGLGEALEPATGEPARPGSTGETAAGAAGSGPGAGGPAPRAAGTAPREAGPAPRAAGAEPEAAGADPAG